MSFEATIPTGRETANGHSWRSRTMDVEHVIRQLNRTAAQRIMQKERVANMAAQNQHDIEQA